VDDGQQNNLGKWSTSQPIRCPAEDQLRSTSAGEIESPTPPGHPRRDWTMDDWNHSNLPFSSSRCKTVFNVPAVIDIVAN
jgi:hypothetical protein